MSHQAGSGAGENVTFFVTTDGVQYDSGVSVQASATVVEVGLR